MDLSVEHVVAVLVRGALAKHRRHVGDSAGLLVPGDELSRTDLEVLVGELRDRTDLAVGDPVGDDAGEQIVVARILLDEDIPHGVDIDVVRLAQVRCL